MKKKIDYPMLILTLALIVVGLISLFTASYALSLSETGDPFRYVERQSIFALIGLGLMIILANFDYRIYHRLAWVLYVFVLLLMLLVLTPLGVSHGGATRWLNLGFTEFQPSELAKTSIILLFASLVVRTKDKMGTFSRGILPFLGLMGGVIMFTVLQKHLSASVIIAVTGILIIFVGGANVFWLAGMGVAGIAGAVFYITQKDYAMARVRVWLDPFIDPLNDGFQGSQSFITIGSGGLFGLGFGQGRQKHLFLPEPENDFIFPVLCEELGFIGACAIILLFAMFIYRGFLIAARAKDKFGMLLCVGIMTKFSIQVLINLFVVTGVMPITGASLPFFSSGGTALVIQICEIGILLNVSKHQRL